MRCTLLGAAENTVAGKGYWLGKNGKYYTTQQPNGYTGSRSGAFSAARNYRIAGRFVFGFGVLLSGVEGINYFNNGNYLGVGKSGLDIGFGALSTYGNVPGLVIGGYYFLIDATRSHIKDWNQTDYDNFYNQYNASPIMQRLGE